MQLFTIDNSGLQLKVKYGRFGLAKLLRYSFLGDNSKDI
jgi:hypothetical protein